MSESNVQREAQIELAKHGIKTFRNNVGVGWIGKLVRKNPDGSILLANARPLHAGLCKGSSDLIGYKSVIITQDMVGQRIAIFAAPEAKSTSGRLTEDQKNFIRVVQQDGGIAGHFRSLIGALELFGIKI
jgi:hypothetical protein